MTSNRDNFNLKVIEKLRSRVGNKCSNPACRKNTSGPKEDDGILSIGIAAHICAAAPGGPRYDKKMSKDERKAFSNGIWLCTNCATLIDKDWISYSINLLKSWKGDAEVEARNNIGKKAETRQDSIDLVTMALSGYPKKYLSNAIKNIHEATSQSLEELDPRFSVISTFDGRKPTFTLKAKQPIDLNFTVKNIEINNEGINKLINLGDSVEFQSDDVSISGSPLIEKIFGHATGTVILSPPEIPAVLKINMIHKKTSVIEALDDLHGMISYGREMFSFDGTCYDGLLGIRVKVPVNGVTGNINTRVNFDGWNSVDIVFLPFFSKLNSFFSKCNEEYFLNLKLEVNGELINEANVDNFNAIKFFKSISVFLEYTRLARIITSKTNAKVKFCREVKVSKEEYKEIKRIAEMLDGGRMVDDSKLQSNIKATMIFMEDSKNTFGKLIGKQTSLRMEEKEGKSIQIFGQSILLPKEIHEFQNVILVSNRSIDELNIGDEFEIEGVPGTDFKYIEKYIE